MKLYYFADGCSLATHIALREAGIVPELVEVDVPTRMTDEGQPFATVNPKGYVPALIMDDGAMLTENVALLDWVAQQSSGLRPADGMARTRQVEMLALISTEIHRMFLVLFFLPGEEAKPILREAIGGRFSYIAERLEGPFLFGDRFTVADAFLYVMLRWARMSSMPVADTFDDYVARIEQRASVRAALEAEGIKTAA